MRTPELHRSRGFDRRLVAIAVLVFAAVVSVLTYFGLERAASGLPDASATVAPAPSTATMFDPEPTLLVIGDSFAGGTGDPTFRVYPELVANTMGWSLALDAEGGSGFVTGQDDLHPELFYTPFIKRLDHNKETYNVDYVLIDGGRNDLGKMPELVAEASAVYIKKVRSYWPNAKIIVVTPSYVSAEVPENYPLIADTMKVVAQDVGAYIIDPVADGWYQSIDLNPLLWRDGVHLNGPGNKYYADKIIDNFRRFNFK